MTISQPAAPAAPPPMRRSLRWLLIGSLTINFLVLGLGIGAVFMGDRHRMEMSLGPFARALNEEDRRAIMREVMQDNGLRHPNLRERAAMRDDLVTALRADPFSPDRVRELIDSQQDWVQSAQSRLQDAVIDRIIAMSPEARLEFADRLSRESGPGRDRAPGD